MKELNLFETRMKSHHDVGGLLEKYVKKEKFNEKMFNNLL